MNELIKFKKHKPKHKYNKITNDSIKNELIISQIMYEMIDNIIVDIDEKECRICFEEETQDNPFITPCRCNGTSKYVHLDCLETWRNENIGRDAFDMCMECRYRYKFLNKFPYEFNSRIPCKFLFIFCMSFIFPVFLSYPLAEINAANNNSITNFYSNKESSLNYFMSIAEMYDPLNYDVCYNIVLFHQTLTFLLFYILFTCKCIHRKQVYFFHVKKYVPFYLFYTLKFLIFVNINTKSISWLNFFFIISFIISLTEPIFYSFVIRKHNEIIYLMDLDNRFIIKNYLPEDDLPLTRSLSDIL